MFVFNCILVHAIRKRRYNFEMCGRYTLRLTPVQLAEIFDALRSPELSFPLRFNVAPTQVMPIVRLDSEGVRRLDPLRWGLVPHWAKDTKTSFFNARAETIAEKPSFKKAFQTRRCLVPADGFYEWKKRLEGKQPYFIRLKDERPFAFAGLWESWSDPAGKSIETFTIITTEANELMRPLHDRMPVIIQDHDRWLATPDPKLLRPFPADQMTAYRVNPIVNNARNDVPDCVQPLDQPT
jgi:putative SOS response-associated peptidase YedK